MRLIKVVAIIVFSFFLCHSIAIAGVNGVNNPTLLKEMYKNPGNYIRFGGQSVGVTLYIERSSVQVIEYNPPCYIISFNEVYYASNGMVKPYFEEMARYSGNIRFLYDYENRKMYIESRDDLGNKKWEYLNPVGIDTVEAYKSGRLANLTAGEIVFYLCYRISFYEKPVFINDTIYYNKPLSTFHND